MLTFFFPFPSFRGRGAKAWKMVRPPPLGPLSPASRASANARPKTGIGSADSSRYSDAMHMFRPVCMHMHRCNEGTGVILPSWPGMTLPGFRQAAHGLPRAAA